MRALRASGAHSDRPATGASRQPPSGAAWQLSAHRAARMGLMSANVGGGGGGPPTDPWPVVNSMWPVPPGHPASDSTPGRTVTEYPTSEDSSEMGAIVTERVIRSTR